MKRISCLVISRSYSLLNTMLASLDEARKEWSTLDEVLCSWNGSVQDEKKIISGERLKFRIGQRVPYHFARNINSLANKAKGDYLLIINDDVILDKHSIDKSIKVLEEDENIGIVGGLLRTSNQTLSHAGVLLSCDLLPYNRCRPEFGNRIDLNQNEVQRSGQITAVTGALILLKKDDLISIPMRETFSNCCEDIALCLDMLKGINKVTYYSSEVTGIHDEKSTRGETNDVNDFEKLKAIIRLYEEDLPQLWTINMLWQAQEGEWLKNMCYMEFMKNQDEEKLIQWQKRKITKLKEELETTVKSWNLDRELLIEGQKELEKRIDDIEASMSWKITKPVRYIKNIIYKPKES